MFDHAFQHGAKRPGTVEMTAMLAALMALNSFAIDAMIPALPQIGLSLHVAAENQRQLVVIAYFLGFGATQLVWGPLADRFGRKPILAAGIVLYAAFALLCGIAWSFPVLIAARICQGASAAVTRVLVIAMVRDLFEAEAMARVMSLVSMIFMVMPVLAPNIGQLILLFGPWRAIFLVLAVYGLVMLAWSGFRLPETLHPEYRRSLHLDQIGRAIRTSLTDPLSRGYTVALTVSSGCLIAYIASIQQIVAEVFHESRYIGIVFAAVAAPMALASWGNARVVGRFGLRRVGHTASAVFAVTALLHAGLAIAGRETLASFIILQALTMSCFAFTSANLSTLAMTNMAEIAGTASSVQGVIWTIAGAAIGFVIGGAFNGTALPFLIGTAACAVAGFIGVVLTEPRRLFAPIGPIRPTTQLAVGDPEDLC
ncbi:MAG TPA: multidrug effflux MFS transporter [Sphingomicrobium sp.]|nr:multidrug effflux MFS transporter [Sphingomicrobium sp.]